MRIARVALSFFAVGFVAGTFEQAAGVGDAQRGHPTSAFVPASMDPPVGLMETATRQPSRGEPVPLVPVAPDGPGVLLQAPTEAREAVAEPRAGVYVVPRPVRVRPEGTLPLAARPNFERQATHVAASGGLDILGAELPGQLFGLRRPMSRPDGSAQSPMPKPAFVSVPPAEPVEAMAAVSEPQLVQAPRLVRDATVPEFIMPIDKGRVTSMFNQGRYHPAIDLAAPLGTPVHATTRNQRVTFAGRRGGYGNLVVARDPAGREHYYGHLQRIVARIGTLLEQGDLLGLLGSTGHSTGPHVHYEVRTRAGGHVNPATLLFPGRDVSRGYAWNNFGTSSRVAMVATPRDVEAAVRPVARRTVRSSHRTTRRYAASRYASARYITRTPRRSAVRYAGRYGQPRPR